MVFLSHHPTLEQQVLAVNCLNPDTYENYDPDEGFGKSMLLDYCRFLDLPHKEDVNSNLCEFQLKYMFLKGDEHHDDTRQLDYIDWQFLKDNPKKKLLITHRTVVDVLPFIDPLNKLIKDYELEGRVFWYTFNPKDVSYLPTSDFEYLFLNSITNVYLEYVIKFKLFNRKSVDSNINPQMTDLRDVEHHFLSLASDTKLHKSLSTYLLTSKNLDVHGNYSFLKKKHVDHHLETEEHFDSFVESGIDISSYRHFLNNHEKILDVGIDSYYPGGVFKNTSIDFLNKSLVNNVLESTHSQNLIFITEKTYANFLIGRPFILTGNQHSLSFLRQYFGFKTFHSIFDESYDFISDPVKRTIAAHAELEKFCHLPLTKAKQKIDSISGILKHNRNVMCNISHSDFFMKAMKKVA